MLRSLILFTSIALSSVYGDDNSHTVRLALRCLKEISANRNCLEMHLVIQTSIIYRRSYITNFEISRIDIFRKIQSILLMRQLRFG